MDEQLERQLRNLEDADADSSVINDVIKNGIEARPGALENRFGQKAMTDLEESVVNHTVDGKTWNTERK